MAYWLVHWTPDQAVWVQTLSWITALCYGKTLILFIYSSSASLHPGDKMVTGMFTAGGNPARD